MRKIKFKAWDTKEGKFTRFMIVENRISFSDGGLWVRDDEQKRFKLLQYTENIDKNGKEIFEGDICFCNSYYLEEGEIGIIEWDKDYGWVIKLKDDTMADLYDLEDLTIVGNIYEGEKVKGV